MTEQEVSPWSEIEGDIIVENEHPADEHPADEYPADEYPADEYPDDDIGYWVEIDGDIGYAVTGDLAANFVEDDGGDIVVSNEEQTPENGVVFAPVEGIPALNEVSFWTSFELTTCVNRFTCDQVRSTWAHFFVQRDEQNRCDTYECNGKRICVYYNEENIVTRVEATVL